MNWLYALFALDILNLAVFLPVFSAFVRSLGGTAFSLGVINSSSAFVSLLWNPIVGSLSDQVGRKGLLIKCLLASATGSIVLALAPNLALVFLGRVIGSMGSPVPILLRSLVADTYKTPEEKKTFFNRSAPFISVAFLVGSLSSGFLSEARNGYSKAFFLMAAITGTASLIVQKTIKGPPKVKGRPKDRSSFVAKATTQLRKVIVNIREVSWKQYKDLLCIKACYDFALAIIFSNLGLLMVSEFHVKGRTIGYVFTIASLSRIVSSVVGLKFKDYLVKLPFNVKVVRSCSLLVVAFVMMSIIKSLGFFLVFLALMCLVRPFMDVTLTEAVATRTTDSDRGKVNSAFENVHAVANFIAPFSAGVLAELVGQRLLINFAAVPISLAIFVAFKSKQS